MSTLPQAIALPGPLSIMGALKLRPRRGPASFMDGAGCHHIRNHSTEGTITEWTATPLIRWRTT